MKMLAIRRWKRSWWSSSDRRQSGGRGEAAKRVDLTAHAKDFPDIEGVGAEVRGIRRVYAWMDERKKK